MELKKLIPAKWPTNCVVCKQKIYPGDMVDPTVDGTLCAECATHLELECVLPESHPVRMISEARLRGMAAGVELATETKDRKVLEGIVATFEKEIGRKPILAIGMTYEQAFDAMKETLAVANQHAIGKKDVSTMTAVKPKPVDPEVDDVEPGQDDIEAIEEHEKGIVAQPPVNPVTPHPEKLHLVGFEKDTPAPAQEPKQAPQKGKGAIGSKPSDLKPLDDFDAFWGK